MKTATIEVSGMLSALSACGVEKQLARLPGVYKVEVNYVAGSATVEYDERITNLKAIKAVVRACGYHCGGEMLPKHVCVPEDPPAAAVAMAPAAPAAHAGHEMTAEPAAPAGKIDAMAHEMGHGASMDMHAMAHDMRNRFWICLFFSVPILAYSPMGDLFTAPAPPFGLALNLWLFFLASAAILYPVWPSFVSAWRALKTGILSMAVRVVLSVGTGYLFSVGATSFFKGEQFYCGADHLRRLLAEAQTIVSDALAASPQQQEIASRTNLKERP
jgi:P-type Cu2+ transporter